MAISRRQLLAGAAVVGPLASHPGASASAYDQFNTSMAKALLGNAVELVNIMAQGPPRDARPFAAAHAVAELVFRMFEETGIVTLLDHHLSELPPSVRPTVAEISATMAKSGMQLPEDRVAGMMTPDTAETAQVRRTGWTGLRQLLLRGLAVGMTALTAPLKMRTRATWEAPWPLVVRTPLLLKDPKLAEDLPRVRAAGKLAIALGVSLEQLRDSNAVDIQAANGTGEMMSPVGTAAIGTGVAVLLICSHAKNRIIASPGRWVS